MTFIHEITSKIELSKVKKGCRKSTDKERVCEAGREKKIHNLDGESQEPGACHIAKAITYHT